MKRRPCRPAPRHGPSEFGHRWTATGPGLECPRWYSIVSSRLGRPVERRRRWFWLLRRVVRQALADQAALVVVEGTAPEPWVVRAAELFHVKTVRLHVADPDQRDRALVDAADQLFVLRVRRGGRIEDLVARRIAVDAASVRVAIDGGSDDAAPTLVARGAVGWWVNTIPDSDEPSRRAETARGDASPAGLTPPVDFADGSWLVHCTRGRGGPEPWQSKTQWRDEVLLGGEGAAALEPIDVLERILGQQRLRGSAAVTSADPVVCFSAVPLPQLLARRTYRPHLGRWDYEPFGIAIRRRVVAAIGALPVIYANSFDASGLSEDQRWRFQAIGTTYDWRTEQEWRVRGSVDLRSVGERDAVVFVGDRQSVRRLAPISRWPIMVVAPAVAESRISGI